MQSSVYGHRLSTLLALVWVSFLGLAMSSWGAADVVSAATDGSPLEACARDVDDAPCLGWEAAPIALTELWVNASETAEVEEEEPDSPPVGVASWTRCGAELGSAARSHATSIGWLWALAGSDITRGCLVRGPPALG